MKALLLAVSIIVHSVAFAAMETAPAWKTIGSDPQVEFQGNPMPLAPLRLPRPCDPHRHRGSHESQRRILSIRRCPRLDRRNAFKSET